MIYSYLPIQCLNKPVDEMEFDEFFRFYAMAEYARELRIQDIELGVNKGIVASFPEE